MKPLAANHNHLMIGILAAAILSGEIAAFALEWNGKPGASAFIGLAMTTLGVLCPSPLKTPTEQRDEQKDKDTADANSEPGA